MIMCCLFVVYGMTECVVTHLQANETEFHKPGSAGFVLANTECKVRIYLFMVYLRLIFMISDRFRKNNRNTIILKIKTRNLSLYYVFCFLLFFLFFCFFFCLFVVFSTLIKMLIKIYLDPMSGHRKSTWTK